MTTRYEATATHEDPWWVVEVPEVGVFGKAASFEEVPAVVRELVALWLEVDPAEVEVRVREKAAGEQDR